MKTYDSKPLEVQLYQFKPNAMVLQSDSELVIQNLHLELLSNDPTALSAIKASTTMDSLFRAVSTISDLKFRNRLMTTVWNRFIEFSNVSGDFQWNKQSRSVQISDKATLQAGQYRDIETVMCVEFRFDNFADDTPVFNVIVKNRLFFSKPLQLQGFSQFLADRRNLYLPAYDREKNFNCVLRNVEFKQVFHYEKKTRKNKNPMRVGERFIQSKRMSEEEYASLAASQERFPMAYCTPYGNKDVRYCYPARDIEISASDSLLKLGNDNVNIEFPEEIQEAISLYRYAKATIREEMDQRTDMLQFIQGIIKSIAVLSEPIIAECQNISKRRYKLKNRTKVNREVKLDESYYCDDELVFGKNALCYPSADNINLDGKEEKFMSFFSEGSKITNFGLRFEKVDYTVKAAVSQPNALAEHICASVPSCNAALLVWPNWPNLPNNKMIEFELMRRGISVQNVVNQNRKDDAPKIPALIKGMAEKFPTQAIRKADEDYSIAPFDFALGLDVSRHGQMDVASFPVVVDSEGRTACSLSETPYTIEKEKRSEAEIISTIERIIEGMGAHNEQVNILFLRDGFAYEDYDLIAQALPDNVTLTVVSVRKNLMGVCAENIPTGDTYSIHAGLDEERFVFGINARQGDESCVSRMHLAQVVTNPLELGMDILANILISLSCQNKTTETEITSLPFPIAYADRMAWTIRDMIQDNQLLKHVKENYPEKCDEAGGAALYIYSELKRFVETRENGYTFAI